MGRSSKVLLVWMMSGVMVSGLSDVEGDRPLLVARSLSQIITIIIILYIIWGPLG